MNKNSVAAKFVRTFLGALAPTLLAASAINWFGGEAALGATKLTLAVVASLVAAVIAALVALTPANPTTALQKGIAHALQMLVAGLGTVVLADLSGAAAVDFGRQVMGIVIAAAFGGFTAFSVNFSEDLPPGPPPP